MFLFFLKFLCVADAAIRPVLPLLPIGGDCPACGAVGLVWGDVVKSLSVACATSRGNNRGKGLFMFIYLFAQQQGQR